MRMCPSNHYIPKSHGVRPHQPRRPSPPSKNHGFPLNQGKSRWHSYYHVLVYISHVLTYLLGTVSHVLWPWVFSTKRPSFWLLEHCNLSCRLNPIGPRLPPSSIFRISWISWIRAVAYVYPSWSHGTRWVKFSRLLLGATIFYQRNQPKGIEI